MNNKILMSLVAASISAMAAAPEVAKANNVNQQSKIENNSNENNNINSIEQAVSATTNNLIKLSPVAKENLSEQQNLFLTDIQHQLDAMLNKKNPSTRISESISILMDNYAHEDMSLKEEVFNNLQLAQNQDSTQGGSFGSVLPAGTSVCHGACHSACHSACHGARGWR